MNKAITFVVNAGMNVTANNFYFFTKKKEVPFSDYFFIQLKFFWIYIDDVFHKFRVIDGE